MINYRIMDNSLQIKFEGEAHQIDANTLINTLIHYNSVLMLINDEYGQGSQKINLVVNAIEKGSFVIDLSVVENLIKSIFSHKSVEYIANIIGVFGGVMSAYKILKGRPAKSDSDKLAIKIDNSNVEINNVVVNVYNDSRTRDAISKAFKTASDDDNVEGVVISSSKKEIIKVDKSEFSDLIYEDFACEEDVPEAKDEIDENAKLTIIKMSFEKGAKWEFLYNGFKIKINVKDDALMDIINKGARFGKGDAIKVTLKIIKKYDSEYNAMVNHSYKIIAFHEHIKNVSVEDTSLFETE